VQNGYQLVGEGEGRRPCLLEGSLAAKGEKDKGKREDA